MPFKSQAQRKLFYAKAARGEISKETLEEWERATPKDKKLPEHAAKSAAYLAGAAQALKEAGLVESKEEKPVLTGTGKQTRLRKDHEPNKFYNVRRSFERSATHKKEIGTHVSLKDSKS